MQFNLDTKPLGLGTWKLTATLCDGSIQEVWIIIGPSFSALARLGVYGVHALQLGFALFPLAEAQGMLKNEVQAP